MSTLVALYAQCTPLIRGEIMILMLLKEAIIKCSVGNIGDARGTSLAKRVIAALPASKANV
jgi:hypothetical protein